MFQKSLVVVSGATGKVYTMLNILFYARVCKSREINFRSLKSGAQDGSIINSLLATGHYKIRGLTHKLNSDKAKVLAAKGVEVVKCDLSVKDIF